MSQTPKRNIRIDNATWNKLKKAANPESVSTLLRRLAREFLDKRKDG